MNFKPTNKPTSGTHYLDEINCSYSALVEIFGEPNSEGDGCKVSTEWILESENGAIVTIYDYKETDLYDKELLSVEQFREQESYYWHIGGTNHDDALLLKEFIFAKLVTFDE